MGTKNTEDPKPPTVPKTSASNERIINMGRYLANIQIIMNTKGTTYKSFFKSLSFLICIQFSIQA